MSNFTNHPQKINIWEIPRSDTRPRCGECLIVLRDGQYRYKVEELKGARYSKICLKCKGIRTEKLKKREAELRNNLVEQNEKS